jgi:hypothetical protein
MYAIWGNFLVLVVVGARAVRDTIDRESRTSLRTRLEAGEDEGPGPDYYEYQVLNKTDPKVTFSGDETELERLLKTFGSVLLRTWYS